MHQPVTMIVLLQTCVLWWSIASGPLPLEMLPDKEGLDVTSFQEHRLQFYTLFSSLVLLLEDLVRGQPACL